MQPFTILKSRVVLLAINNIDTDQIIPARFLKTTEKAGLGDNLFADWRYNPDGTPKPDFILNNPESQTAQILLVGNNFGCGSSREHAPWALTGFGFRAVISTAFADIFYNNALKNGLLPIRVNATAHEKLVKLFTAYPQTELTIDLKNQAIFLPDDDVIDFPLDSFSKSCLLRGVDELGYLLNLHNEIATFEAKMEA